MAVVERIPKDCPKCHGDVVMVSSVAHDDEFVDEGRITYTVLCPECMYGSSPMCFTREQALKSWEETKEIVLAEIDLRRNRG